MTKEEILKAADDAVEMFAEFVDNREDDFLRKKCAILHYEKIVEIAESVDLYFKVDDYKAILTELKSRL